jgi:hypothetical protein
MKEAEFKHQIHGAVLNFDAWILIVSGVHNA